MPCGWESPKGFSASIVNGLIGYVGIHFSTEEKYFAQFNYPETDQHIQEHKAFSAKVDDFAKKFQERPTRPLHRCHDIPV